MALCLFIVVRYYALGDEEGINNSAIPIGEWLKIGVIFGCIVGTFYAIIEFLFDQYLSKQLPLWAVILLKLAIYFTVLIWSTSYVFGLMESVLELNYLHEGDWWKSSKIFWLIVVYFFLASLIFSFIKIANEKFGKGVFLKLLFGTYRKPIEEKRIFMFLDLKSSTTIAENLGHFKYSKLIQDCFYDLNRVLIKYEADVYQYIGDEAVLTWSFKNGIRQNNCIKIFFAFEKRLMKNKKYYKNKYNLQPTFKAGLHGGKLIATEVGTVKKEIAFHGDVINTTARIQGKCNKFDESLLISEELMEKMKFKKPYSTKLIGTIPLEGKEEKVTLFAVHKQY